MDDISVASTTGNYTRKIRETLVLVHHAKNGDARAKRQRKARKARGWTRRRRGERGGKGRGRGGAGRWVDMYTWKKTKGGGKGAATASPREGDDGRRRIAFESWPWRSTPWEGEAGVELWWAGDGKRSSCLLYRPPSEGCVPIGAPVGQCSL